MASVQGHQTFRFGAYEVDFRAGELRKHGIRIKLQEKPLQVLAALLEHAGRVVTREDLHRCVWSGDSLFDFEHSMNIAITKLRLALGDSAKNPRFIETLPRHGYRFIAPVESWPANLGATGKLMLAVMPFSNLSGDSEQEYFSDGLTEDMITELGRLHPARLGVIARTTAMHYVGTRKRVDEIGHELGVHYILEGSVRRAGNRVRITAQLIQVQDQTHLWAATYDRQRSDVLDIQREVARRIARSLAVELLPPRQTAASRAGSRDTAAHEAYLKGRYFWSRRTEESFQRALEYLEKAIRLDPNYALAYAGVADAYNAVALYGGVPPRVARLRAKEAALKGLEIDDKLAEAHAALGYALLLFDWDWKASETAFRKAIACNPNYVTGHHWYAFRLALLGNFDQALLRIDMALKLDLLSVVTNTHRGWILYFARRFAGAAEQLRHAIDLDANFALSHYFLGLTYLQMAKIEDAIEEFQQARYLSANHPAPIAGMGVVHALLGRRAEARRCLATLEELRAHRHVSPFFTSWVYIALGETRQALAMLEEAREQRCGWVAHLNVEPLLDPLRSEPEFQDLLRRIGFPPKPAACASAAGDN